MKKYLEIYQNFVIFTIMCNIVKCANYDRYPESSSRYPYPVSTVSNLYDQQYKLGTYGSDIANFPEATRYPNYNPGHTTPRYDSFTTPRSNVFDPAYQSSTGYQSNVPNYNTAYGQGLGQGYGQGQGLGQGYGQGQGLGLGQSYGQGQTSYEMPFMGSMRDYCQDRSAQKDILLDNLMGMWYAVEHIQHLAGDSRVDRIRTCIVILISEPMDRPSTEYQLFHVQHINAKFRQEWRHIRLLWDEAGLTTEYTLYFKNDSAGYWQNFGRQNGTLASQPNYQQFGGTVQVLKAVNDHLVLNFCQEASSGQAAQLYTVLFTRLPGHMDQWELDGIHNMLQNKKLSVASRRMVCGNSSVKAIYSVAMMVMSCLFALVIRTS